MFASQSFDIPVRVNEPGFTACDLQELLSFFDSAHDHHDHQAVTTTTIDSPNSTGSEESNYRSVYYNNNNNNNNNNNVVDERKQKRMVSNRESARRSRWRKKRHLENLTEQANRLKTENQDLRYALGSTLSQCNVVWKENQRLRSESVDLRGRLSSLCCTLVAMHGHASNNYHNGAPNYYSNRNNF